MPKPLAPTFATVFGSVAEELKRRLGDAQAAQQGPPMGEDIEPAGDDERVRAWNTRAPEATDEAMRALAAQKIAEHLQTYQDVQKAIKATAEDLTHAMYTQRLGLYTYGQPDFKDQVKEAERIARLAKRTSTPNPAPPPPTMRSAALTGYQQTGEGPHAESRGADSRGIPEAPLPSAPQAFPPAPAPAGPNGTMPSMPPDMSAGLGIP